MCKAGGDKRADYAEVPMTMARLPFPGRGKRALAVSSGLLMAMLAAGPVCNESLPPYINPRDAFSGSVQGAYVLTMSDNSVKIYLDVTNRYDETLEGPALLNGEIEISLATDPLVTKTFAVSSANLLTTRNYNPTTGRIRIDPGETIRFGVSWNLVADNGTNLRTDVFRYWEDTECAMRCVAEEEVFVIRASVDIFEQTSTVVAGPASFSLCHVSNYVEPRFCPPVDYTTPCSKRAVTSGQGARRCP